MVPVVMKLVLGIADCWKKVDVLLQDGCQLNIAGTTAVTGSGVEHALWFKVLVLNYISIDCSQRVISWMGVSNSQTRSLMAPYEGSTPAAWTDELACVFELAEALLETAHVTHTRHQQVEHKTWVRLVQSYLLPLINFSGSDLSSLELAQSEHTHTIGQLDEMLSETASQTMKVKRELADMRTAILPSVSDWAESGQCTRPFLELLIDDIRDVEDTAREKIKYSTCGLSSADEQLLVDMLTLRSHLHTVLVSMVGAGGHGNPAQDKYVELHKDLSQLRETSSMYSERKVLALSVRDGLDQAVMDVRHGGHSTSLLPQDVSSEYKTVREKLLIVLNMSTTQVALLHTEFCSRFCGSWLDDFVVIERPHFSTKHQCPVNSVNGAVDISALVQVIQTHFAKMIQTITVHFNNNDQDFVQRMRLAYEKIFFELFHKDVITLYLNADHKFCQSLQLNAIGASLLAPDETLPSHVTALFTPRSFSTAVNLYNQLTEQLTSSSWQHPCTQDYTDHFRGMTFDLCSLGHVCSPLEKLQLLTSAFRKCMTVLSGLQATVVSCDDLLPVLVMALVRAHPSLLATLHVNTIFLNDFIAPFLASGCHGYSLTSFSSVIQIISDL